MKKVIYHFESDKILKYEGCLKNNLYHGYGNYYDKNGIIIWKDCTAEYSILVDAGQGGASRYDWHLLCLLCSEMSGYSFSVMNSISEKMKTKISVAKKLLSFLKMKFWSKNLFDQKHFDP